MTQLETLQSMIAESSRIVFFGGAGVSTESGIPDFRSVDGLYQEKYPYPPETMLSHSFFKEHTQEFYQFYRDKMVYLDAKPNYAHTYLAQLEQQGKLSAIVTQNIDNLHYQAGSKTVYELHGNVHRNYCMSCNHFYTVEELLALPTPNCSCGGLIKPDVVLYEEGLPQDTVQNAVKAIAQGDMLIIAGTSLAVYPAASFVEYYRGNKLVIINKTPLQVECDLHIEGAVAETFAQLG